MTFKQKKHHPNSVSVSALTDMLVCENIVVLKEQKHRPKYSQESKQAIVLGNQEHQRFHRQVLTQKSSDPRCFIATAVFGANHPHTVLLRKFRDHYLLPNKAGQWLVSCYYRFSPAWVKAMGSSPGKIHLIRFGLSFLIRMGLSVAWVSSKMRISK